MLSFYLVNYTGKVLVGLLVDPGCSLKGLVKLLVLPSVTALLPMQMLLISQEKYTCQVAGIGAVSCQETLMCWGAGKSYYLEKGYT